MESIESPKILQTQQPKSLEGEIITGRGLKTYERILGFDAELLRGETVLNFGPGLTHLEQQLGERGVPSTVVNLDIIKEPLISANDVVRYGATLSLDLYRRLLEKFGGDTTKVRALQKSFLGVKDKTFVQYDGRKIPFADGSFDHVLALWSTYQIPAEQREGVFRELLRVGRHIHIGPIGRGDFHVLGRLAGELGFDVVACASSYLSEAKRRVGLGYSMKTTSDYDAYLKQSASDRIHEPLIDDLTFTVPGIGTRMLHPIQGGSTIILKKKEGFMGEQSTDIQYVGVGKPEEFKPIVRGEGEATHPAVGAVKRMVAGWWERVGPGGVEKSWVNAHKNILANIKETERYAAFEKTGETWRKVGKFFGIASTVVDFSLSGLGLVLMGKGLQNPLQTENVIDGKIGKSNINWLQNFYYRLQMGKHWKTPLKNIPNDYIDKHLPTLGVAESLVPGVGGVGIALGVGPAHISLRLGAKVAEFFGVAAAKVEDYIGSGRLAEHAKAVGEVLDKGVRVAAKNPDLVPEKYRKTVQTIAEMREDEERIQKEQGLRNSMEEKGRRQGEYKAWTEGMDQGLRSYYEQSGQWPPSMEDYLKVQSGVKKDQAKQEQMAREKRG
ncbi:MAG: class I SAM-dependent methyltransferase [Candidatus Gottesmanbacteria bacterium]|nr:class I SAM-dependent methyltransferase [Candidatus Gottesmanbacteria bacterium]